MKKLTTVLITLMLVFGLSAIAAIAQTAEVCTSCANHCDTPGAIDRGCEVAQSSCHPFDFDEPDGYCTGKQAPHHAAFINICTCADEDLFTQKPEEGDTIDVSMEILVDKNDGNGPVSGANGVYWAQDVREDIGLDIFHRDSDLCEDDPDIETHFDGPFIFLDENNDEAGVYSGGACTLDDNEKAVKIVPDTSKGAHGYVIGEPGPVTNECWYNPDIPAMRADTSEVQAGWKVYVRICLTYTNGETQVVCPIDCCTDVYIGSLCCGTEYDMVYPYVPNLDLTDPANTWWSGLVVTNVTSNPGSATITLYESDGDVGQWTNVSVPANGNFLTANTQLMANLVKISGSGTLGDSNGYFVVSPNFAATGYMFIGNAATGKAMGNGYIPVSMSGLMSFNGDGPLE